MDKCRVVCGGDGVIICKLPYNNPEVWALIQLAIGSPISEKIETTLVSYNKSDHHLLGYYEESKLIALIGLQIHKNTGIIKHIAVLESYQRQGIGKQLIMDVAHRFQLKIYETETDEEGKGFYEKCGFQCSSFEGKYNTRYRCEWMREN